MRFLNARTILATAVVGALVVQGSSAAPKSAPTLKIGEVQNLARSSYYSAFSLFVLTSGTLEQKTLVIDRLIKDGSPEALDSLAEIAELSDIPPIAEHSFNAIQNSREALSKIATLSAYAGRREAARLALERIEPRAPIAKAAKSALDDLDLSFIQKSLKQPGDFTKLLSVGEDLTNGSRYVIQSWFLKKLLSLQNAPPFERIERFNYLLSEVSVYLSRPAEIKEIKTPADLEAFKSSLNSRFAFLQDEMKFSKGLTDQNPVVLKIAPEMQAAVQDFSASYRQFDQKIDFLRETTIFDLLSNAKMPGLLMRLKLKSETEAEKIEQLGAISDQFENQYKSLQTVAQHLIDSKAIQFANPAEQRFFELMVTHYFSTYSFEETANVMKALLERPDRKDLFRLMVLYAGPQMQKLLQVISRRPGISPELSSTFKELEESGLSSPWERVGENFTAPPKGTTWVSLEHEARVGSIAEVYKGVVERNGRPLTIAARTLKSDIRQRVENEIPRLVELGRVIDTDPLLRKYDFPLVGPMMDDVMAMTRIELDVQQTIANQKHGDKIYTSDQVLPNGVKVHFRTSKTFEAENKDVIYSTWLIGEKFEDFAKRNPTLAVEIAELTAYHWIENALFGERFFHADLHQGNLKIAQNSEKDLTVGLLDFGMVGRISERERSVIIRLSLATSRNKNAALIAKYLWDLSETDRNTITLPALVDSARDYLTLNGGPNLTMDLWLAWSLSKGLKLPKNITAFSRGIGAIEQLTFATGSSKWLADMVKEVALRHKLELAPDLALYLRDSVTTAVNETVRRFKGRAPTCESLFAN